MARAVELSANHQLGILPRAGGWDDQDPDDVFLMRIASQAKAERQRINQLKQDRKRSK